ncbi:CHAP domain-containing protein, partial [Streptacidiphilus jiangxiensis]|uniref:CHAP domain-containing protein n=1 Tax=Streptacidiphilus jiangxiensis TaxID=235985 RepID=A0A1H7ZYA1_STRJI
MNAASLRSTLTRGLVAVALAGPTLLLVSGPASASTDDIVNIANANMSNHACDTNSTGGQGYNSSCTGDGGSPENWCADFAAWVWQQAGYNVDGLTPAAGSFDQYGAGVHSDPQVGDAILFDDNGSGYADHVAIVTAVNPDGTIQSIGGNEGTNDPSTSYVNSDSYEGTVGYSSYWGMTISGYVSPTN